jgi:hypothetical protein
MMKKPAVERGSERPVKKEKRTRSKKDKSFSLHEHIAELQRQMGTHFSPNGRNPGDVAWRGPCENGKQMVCRFDDSMMPSLCGPEPCA